MTYSESDINDLVNPNSCYYNHSYPSMRNLFAYIGVPEHTEIRAALSSNPGACQWGCCHTVADVGCTHDKPYNGRNLSTVCCANSYCYGGAPMGGRGEAARGCATIAPKDLWAATSRRLRRKVSLRLGETPTCAISAKPNRTSAREATHVHHLKFYPSRTQMRYSCTRRSAPSPFGYVFGALGASDV